ncbi:MAG TPA: hypothetical protein VMT67_01055 [Terriglobales bacterium]|nr:hypothetical protein [Terriglobales bacterium]
MTDAQLDELERLIRTSKQPAQPISGATALALIAEVRELRRDAESWRAHMREVEHVRDLECRGFGRDGALAQGKEGA